MTIWWITICYDYCQTALNFRDSLIKLKTKQILQKGQTAKARKRTSFIPPQLFSGVRSAAACNIVTTNIQMSEINTLVELTIVDNSSIKYKMSKVLKRKEIWYVTRAKIETLKYWKWKQRTNSSGQKWDKFLICSCSKYLFMIHVSLWTIFGLVLHW